MMEAISVISPLESISLKRARKILVIAVTAGVAKN